MNNIDKEFFISKLTEKKETYKDKTIYNILPQYGNGKIVLYKIIHGMYLSFNEFKFKEVIKREADNRFSDFVIEIDYCLDGDCIVKSLDGTIQNVIKGKSISYGGINNSSNTDLNGIKYKSINILCYLSEITNSIEQIYGVSKDRIQEYYEKLFKKKNNSITIQSKIISILDEITEYIKYDYVDLIKVKAIELFLLEINRFKQHQNEEKKYYTRVQVNKVNKIKNIIENNYYKNFTIKDLAKMQNINTTDLKRCFKNMFGYSVYSYKKRYRMRKARELLLETDYKIYEIVQKIGYSDAGQFAKSFKCVQGVTPTQYRRKYKEVAE